MSASRPRTSGPGAGRRPVGTSDDPVAVSIEDAMMRALAVLRVVVLVNTIGIYIWHVHLFPHPWRGWFLLVLLTLWSAYTTFAYADAARRRPWVFVADVVVAVGIIEATPLVKGWHPNATLPGFWVAAPVLACALHWKWRAGLVSSVLVAAADLSLRDHVTQSTYGNLFLLVIAGTTVGYLVEKLEELAVQRDRAERLAAAASERQRIARVVHDGVLQVLALVQRRGIEIGGEAGELGRLAGEQEAALRAFVQHDSLVPVEIGGELDLADELTRLQTSHVSVAVPGTPFALPASTALEVLAVVAACLSNVRHHVGREAPAWVLLDDRGDTWVVSVRDNGPGIPAGRLDDALTEGRLGVAESIVRRVEGLGGTPHLRSAPGEGVEWEFTFSRALRDRRPDRVSRAAQKGAQREAQGEAQKAGRTRDRPAEAV